jgi:hypothetical protein
MYVPVNLTALLASSFLHYNFSLIASSNAGGSNLSNTASAAAERFPTVQVGAATHVVDAPDFTSSVTPLGGKMRTGHERRRSRLQRQIKRDASLLPRRRSDLPSGSHAGDDDDWQTSASFLAEKTRRSLNIFGHDGGAFRRPKAAMLYSVVDRKFLELGMDGTVGTTRHQDSMHGK